MSSMKRGYYFLRLNGSRNKLPCHYNGVGNLDRTFPVTMRKERIIRFILILISLAFMTVFMSHIRVLPIEPSFNSYEQIHIYRIIGNDLPPRHKVGQVLQNTRFILENEPDFPNTKKWWIINRIVDNEYENAIIDLLKQHKKDYIRIPFNVDEYLRADFRLEDFPEPDFFHSYEFMNFTKVAKIRTIDYTYHDKNIYVMNNNGGRNVALKHGQSQPNARWIFPFDGNCFITNSAFTEITSQIEKWGKDYKYFVVPMARLLNNSQLLSDSDQKPETPEEPQIIFRHDAEEKYNENMRYGRRSKGLCLILNMIESPMTGVPTPSRFIARPVIPWETNENAQNTPSNYTSKSLYMKVGWVFRLFSGQASQELNQKESGALRAFNRLLAIQDLIDGIDERIARTHKNFNPDRLFLYDENSLSNARIKYWSGDEKITRIVDVMLNRADEITSEVSDLHKVDDSLFLNTSIQITFLKLNTDSETNLPDGESNEMPELESRSNEMPELESKSNEMPELDGKSNEMPELDGKSNEMLESSISTSQLFENITTLTLAQYFSGNFLYSRWAANLIRTFLLSSYGIGEEDKITLLEYNDTCLDCNVFDEGYGFPYLNKIPRTIPKNSESSSVFYKIPKDIFETDPSHFLDSCKLLYRIKALTHREFVELQALASYWLEYLISSPEGTSTGRKPDHRGTLYDLQILSLSGFIDDVRLHLRVSNRLRMRIGKQFYIARDVSLMNAAKISQPYEMMYVKNMIRNKMIKPSAYEDEVFRYKSLNLHYWMLITRIIQNVKVSNDLWLYKSKDGQKLSKAIMSHLNKYEVEGRKKHGLFLLKPLMYIAHKAHKISSKFSQRNNENEYFQRILIKFSEKYSFDYSDESERRENIDSNVGLGNRIRKNGVPPFWMFGIA
ncbi:6445_t:CDS:2 [Dentiscutata heterogama]|uniref:6445_t:CDS:1 n=1 Tax=Dentiscutata heterogama TaxID=1316150 RepID=A0ACA9K910_9GLOM|nr:6445_t:CDS:2 [Dentiscutata heterogama]